MYVFRWNEWNIQHVGEHGVTPADAEHLVNHARAPFPRRQGGGRYLVMGRFPDGSYGQAVRLESAGGCVRHSCPAADGYREASIAAQVEMMKGKKPYWKMTAAELREATREFDKPFAFEAGKPLTAGDKQKLRQAREHARKVKRGRPRVGLGASRITTTVERSLLERVDAFAEAHQMTRAEVIAKGMERVLADGG